MAEDYRDVVKHPEKPDKRGRAGYVRSRWWEVDGDEVAQSVVDTGTSLLNSAGDRHAAMVRHARLYENCDFDSLNGRDYDSAVARQIMTSTGMMSLNVGASCVDTLTAKVTKNRPRPSFLTSGASWAGQIKGRALDKWSRGFFYETQVYRKARQVFVDGCEFGTGFLQVFEDEDGKLGCERVLPNEILIDDLDGANAAPRQLIRLKYVARDILCRLFPKHAQAIMDAGKSSKIESVNNGQPETVENTIEVWEAWHLPSGKKAKDGKHVIAIDGCALLEERWNICKFPFVTFRFKQRTTGFWGKGVIETVQPIQVELNRTVRSISRQMHRKGKGRTYVQIGSKIVPSHLTNNDGGDIVMYTGAMPQDAAHNVIAPEEFNYVTQLRQQAFQECGISELSAASKKPAGLDAAVALREYSDIESERFAPVHQEWEQFFLDYADLAIELITKQYGWKSYKVLVPGRRDLLEVDWAAIDLERDAYIMQMWPVSSLPQTPSARYQKVKEMMQDGFIDKAVAQRLLEYPDVEAETNLVNAMIDDVDATISKILDDDEPTVQPLEPYQNISLLITRATSQYLYARHRNCPEERLSLLRNLIDTATAQMAAMQAPPPAPMGPPPGPEMGAPPPQPGMGGGGTQVNNTLNVPPPIIPTVPPVVG
jgi:hypothetical protein